MTVTVDMSTLIGKTRLLALGDTDDDAPIFSDEEYTAFLAMSAQSPVLAAAKAIRVVAGNQVYRLKAIKLLGLTTNAHLVGAELRAIADDYEQRFEAGDDGTGDWSGMLDFVDVVYDEWSFRERIRKEFEREYPGY